MFTIDLWAILLLLFLVVTILPVIQQTRLQRERRRVMQALERTRGSRVITLIHRQEVMSILGIPFLRYIDINDSEEILRVIRMTPRDTPIDFILHTPGGLVLSAEQIALALKRHTARVTVIVPHYAMSGGTLLCLAADEVLMDENAVLGPVDPQLGEYPAASILDVLQKKEAKDIDDKTFILANIAEKAQKQMKEFVTDLLLDPMGRERAEEISSHLTSGQWTHDYPITCERAKGMGLQVSCTIPAEIYDLMDLFPQAMQRRPSVEYVPLPYRKEREKKE